jgi:hypothetical protein
MHLIVARRVRSKEREGSIAQPLGRGFIFRSGAKAFRASPGKILLINIGIAAVGIDGTKAAAPTPV